MSGHLIHLGYPKTGSNLLRRWFAAHPQLDYADGGIAGFRDVYEIVRRGAAPPSESLYRVTSAEGFATPQPSFGHPVTDYDLPRLVTMSDAQLAVCRTLAELFPNAKVLLVTRGFRSALVSMYSQFARSGGSRDFADFCAGFEGAIAAGRDGWNYCGLVAAYASAFGAENVIVLPYELLRDDSDAFIGALETRLGLDHFATPRGRPNPSLSPEEMYWYPRITRAVKKIAPRKVFRRYARAAFRNRLRLPIRVLQRLRPGRPVDAAAIPETLIEALRGRADCLRGNPLYAPYAGDYLW